MPTMLNDLKLRFVSGNSVPVTSIRITRDELDYLVRELQGYARDAIADARRVWMQENPPEDGEDHVTPFDHFLYR